jgi:tRNA(fMet)-specific endonuclease VapC
MTLLDTDIFTLVLRGNPVVRPRVETELLANNVSLPVFVKAESLRGWTDGLVKAGTSADVRRMQERLFDAEEFLKRFPIIPFDDGAAVLFENLRRDTNLKKRGLTDLLIACIALANRATLVTRNTKDFAGIPNLNLENLAD